MIDNVKSPKFFKWAYVAGGFTQFSSALSVSTNTLLVALGANPFQISIANSAKLLGQIFSQVFGLKFVNLFTSHRRSMMWALSLELIIKLGLAVVAFTVPVNWFLITTAILFLLGLTAYTVFLNYYSWMGEIVPANLKDRFFANRSLVGQVLLIIGFFISSWVFKIDKPILFLLGTLYVAYYFARNVEVFSYLFHPDAVRQTLIKNNILERMRQPFKNGAFMSFTGWYNLVNTASILNLLFLEFFIIHILKLPFYWIPLSFVLMALGSIAGLTVMRIIFPQINRKEKLILVSLLVLISSIAWLLSKNVMVLGLALLLAGWIDSAITLVQRVEVINYSENKDKEGYYAAFNTTEYIISAIAVLALGLVQKSVFSFNLIFFITIPLSLIALVLTRIIKLSDPKVSVKP